MNVVKPVTQKELYQNFPNGLTISPSSINLGAQSWAVGQVKSVGIRSSGSGIGMIICGLLVLLFVPAFILSMGEGDGGASMMGLFLAALCAYGVYSSWIAVNTLEVWIQTSVLPTVVFRTRDASEAQRVKAHIERAIAEHTPK